jgi:hypothetical protein
MKRFACTFARGPVNSLLGRVVRERDLFVHLDVNEILLRGKKKVELSL